MRIWTKSGALQEVWEYNFCLENMDKQRAAPGNRRSLFSVKRVDTYSRSGYMVLSPDDRRGKSLNFT